MAKQTKLPLVTVYCGTRGRYPELALLINSLTNQTYKYWDLIIFDDNEQPTNITSIPFIAPFLAYMNYANHRWSVLFGPKKGPHAIHKLAVQSIRSPFILRVDDDLVLDREYIESLVDVMLKDPSIGAVGGLVLNPSISLANQTIKNHPKQFTFADKVNFSGRIMEENNMPVHSPFLQWTMPAENTIKEVQHLHCSFMYSRMAAITSNSWDEDAYDALSPKGHNEETMGSYSMWLNGYKLFIEPKAVAWHLYSPGGGIRHDPKADHMAMKAHDDKMFVTWYNEQKKKFPEKFNEKLGSQS